MNSKEAVKDLTTILNGLLQCTVVNGRTVGTIRSLISHIEEQQNKIDRLNRNINNYTASMDALQGISRSVNDE